MRSCWKSLILMQKVHGETLVDRKVDDEWWSLSSPLTSTDVFALFEFSPTGVRLSS